MVRVSQANFPPDEQEAFSKACRAFGCDPNTFNYGATGDMPALGAGLMAREISVVRNGRAAKYSGPDWINQFAQELATGAWGSP